MRDVWGQGRVARGGGGFGGHHGERRSAALWVERKPIAKHSRTIAPHSKAFARGLFAEESAIHRTDHMVREACRVRGTAKGVFTRRLIIVVRKDNDRATFPLAC